MQFVDGVTDTLFKIAMNIFAFDISYQEQLDKLGTGG
jgi:hypothetical protein